MRVIGGSLRGRRITPPREGRTGTRPTSDLVRGAVFNSLASLGAVDDASVWDLFAGSGALGLEAISRGARAVTFVEHDRRAAAVVRSNLAQLGVEEQGHVIVSDVLSWVRRSGAEGATVDVVLADPPYGYERWDELLEALSAAAPAVVVCESDGPVGPGSEWRVVRERRHGGTVVTLLEPRGAPAE